MHWSLVCDIVEYDEFLTGERREAQYDAFIDVIPKLVEIPSQVSLLFIYR